MDSVFQCLAQLCLVPRDMALSQINVLLRHWCGPNSAGKQWSDQTRKGGHGSEEKRLGGVGKGVLKVGRASQGMGTASVEARIRKPEVDVKCCIYS